MSTPKPLTFKKAVSEVKQSIINEREYIEYELNSGKYTDKNMLQDISLKTYRSTAYNLVSF